MPGSSPGMTSAFRGVRLRIASHAPTSIFKQPKRFQTCLHAPAARCARAVHLSLAPFEGVGNAGCPLHPRPRVHFVLVESTRVTTSTPESPGIPARNGFTAYVALSPVTGLFCHRRLRKLGLSAPGRGRLAIPQNLTPASGRQDHTILPSAATSLVRSLGNHSQASSTCPAIPSRAKRCRVHRTPSRVRDDRDTPLCVGRDGANL